MKPEHIIHKIRSASREMVREFGFLNDRFSSIGTPSQCHALLELDLHGFMNLSELSIVLNLDKSTTSRLVAQLVKNGLCKVQSDESDRRNKQISLTQKGLNGVAELHAESKKQVELALSLLGEEEIETVVRGMSLYARALKRSRVSSEYSIRKLLKKDVPSITALIKKVWVEFGFDSNHADSSDFDLELNRFYETFSCEKSKYFLLSHKEAIVGGAGYASLPHGPEDVGELKTMYFSSHIRGLGLGSFLLNRVLKEMKASGFNHCYIETMDYMTGANTLYKKMGFKRLDQPMGDTGHTWTNCWYLKPI